MSRGVSGDASRDMNRGMSVGVSGDVGRGGSADKSTNIYARCILIPNHRHPCMLSSTLPHSRALTGSKKSKNLLALPKKSGPWIS